MTTVAPSNDVSLSFVSVFADDVVTLSSFYGEVFGLPEVESLTSPHFRGVLVGSTVLGFSAAATAYELLDLPRPEPSPSPDVRSFTTFEVPGEDDVGARVETAVAAGATLVQPPHRTYYGAWQAVLRDPEGNAFRVNHLPGLPGRS